LLFAAGLVRLIEQWADLRIFAEHQLVEVPGQGFAAGFQQRHCGLDQGTLLGSEH